MYKLRQFFLLFLLLLPASCNLREGFETTIPVPRDDQFWIWKNELINEIAQQGGVDLVFIGDSITDFWTSEDRGKTVWDQYYGERNAANFGIAGDRTQHVLWRIENGNFDGLKPKLIVLLIGTNNLEYNSTEEIAAGVIKIVKTLRRMKLRAKILLLGIFPRGMHADDPFRIKIKKTNSLFKRIADGRNIKYFDIEDVFLDDSGDISSSVMDDYLHLTTFGYQLWADAIELNVQEMMGE